MALSAPHAAQTYTDFNGLAALRKEAKDNSPEALKEVARQFESLFMQMMLKSMRDASLADGIFDNQQSDMYMDMYDKQLATSLSGEGHGIGLAEIMVRQLQSRQASETGEIELSRQVPERRHFGHDFQAVKPAEEKSAVESARVDSTPLNGDPDLFVSTLLPHARQAAQRLGVDPSALLAQAALETGWGKAVIRHPDGSSSHNLFNIKADHRWDGEAVAKQTLEYRDGIARKEPASFRAYDDYAQAFNDYVDFLQSNPRYSRALTSVAEPKRYIEELQQAGYATDPNYANKINRIISSDMPDLMAGVKLSENRTLSNG